MFVFVTDRLLTVFAPYWYYKRNHRKYVVVPLSVAAWFFAIVYGLIPMPFILDCHEYGRISWGCTVSKGCKYPDICDAYKNASVVLSNVIGGLIPLVMYIVLYCKARQLKRRMPTCALSKVTVDNSLVQESSSMCEKNVSDQKKFIVLSTSNSDHSNGNDATDKKQKQDRTATITFAFLFLALIGVSFPSTFFFVIGTSAFKSQGVPPPEIFVIFSTIFRTLFNFLVVIDPIAIMRNRDVKIAFREFYCRLRYKWRREARPVKVVGHTMRKISCSNDSGSIDPKEDFRRHSTVNM